VNIIQKLPQVRTLLCYAVAVGVLAQAAPAGAVGEQVGRIRGVITNPASGQPLDAVSVTATGPALIGGPRSVFSNASGRYEIGDLPPGSYQVSFAYPGTKPITRTVTVRQGEALALNVGYSLEVEGAETISITAGRQLTKPDSAQTGSVRELDSLDRLPTQRTYQLIAQQVPGVTGGGNPNIKGGASDQNKFLIDGLDVTDPVTNGFAQNLTFDSTQSIDIITGGMDAEYNALGGVINVITRGGGDNFRSVASVYANHSKLSATGNYGPNLYETRQPLNETAVGPTETYQASIEAGGPIIKRRLWYGATYEFDYTKFSPSKAAPLGVAPYDIQHPARLFIGHLLRVKLAAAPTDKHRLWLSANTDPATIENTAQGNSRLGVAENRQRQGGIFGVAGWEWRISENIVPSIQVGLLESFLDIGPMGWYGSFDNTGCTQFNPINCTYDRDRPRHTNSVDNTVWHQGNSRQDDKRHRLQIDPSVRIRGNLAGVHTLKLGVQGQWARHSWDYRIPGNSIYTDSSPTGQRLEEGLCDPMAPGPNCFLRTDVTPFKTVVKGWGVGFFAQDRWWTPLQWLTLNPGIRFDYGATNDHLGRSATRLFAIAPRFGFTADVTQDGKNILFGFAGRNTEVFSLSAAADFASTEAYADSTHRWDQDTMTWQQIAASGGEGGAIIDKNAKVPRSDELTGGFRREILPNTVASVEYTFKRIAHAWDTIEINRIWDPSGSRTVGWVDQTKVGREVFLSATPEDPVIYHGASISTEGRPTRNWEYGSSYTLAWTTFRETVSNTRFSQFARGYAGSDIRHYLRLFGSYIMADRVVLGGFFQYQSGSPLTKGFFNQEQGDYSNTRSPSGTTPGSGTSVNDPSVISEFRVPDFVQLDLRFSVNLLPKSWRQELNLVVDIFNVLNLRTPTGITSDDIARFGQVSARQRPFRAQIGLRYAFGATPITRSPEDARSQAGGDGPIRE
jgi:hypothetical protein